MRAVIAILFIGILARHVIPNWLWQGTGISKAGWFYIFGGFLEVLFCLVILYIAKNFKTLIKKWEAIPHLQHEFFILLIKYAILIGVCEGIQISACRLAILNFGSVPRGANLCDFAAVVNFNYFIKNISPSLMISRETVPLTPTIWSVYLFSFLYHLINYIKKIRLATK